MEMEKKRVNWARFYLKRLFWRVLVLVLLLGVSFAVPFIWPKESKLLVMLVKINSIAIVAFAINITNVLINIAFEIMGKNEKFNKTPVKGVIQIAQIVFYFIGAIIVIAIIIDKSPSKLLTGLGAFAAVLSFIFKDTILGFVSGIQLSSNDMVRKGDWITVPGTLADGEVIDISLITVKVQNFDNTIVTVPAYSLVSSSFQNWRGMEESAGRRITITLNIDMDSVKFCTPDELERFGRYVQLPLEKSVWVTNLELFRIYLATYIHKNPQINNSILTMVRYLNPTPTGLPLQIYCFSSQKGWVMYEGVRASITEHAIAMAEEFDLKIFNWNGRG